MNKGRIGAIISAVTEDLCTSFPEFQKYVEEVLGKTTTDTFDVEDALKVRKAAEKDLVNVCSWLAANDPQNGAIVSAYTGYLACSVSELKDYAEKVLRRNVSVGEFSDRTLKIELKAAAREDFFQFSRECGLI